MTITTKKAKGSVLCLAVALSALSVSPGLAEDLPEWIKNTKVSGYFFGDAYGVGGHHDPAIEGENGFWFRRAYLTVDSKVAENTDVRVRFEANSLDGFTTTTPNSSNLFTYLKDLWVRWKHGSHELYAGLAPAVTWELIEPHWGYRQVEKTPLDLYKWGSSRDIGFAAKGAIDSGKKFRYHAMLGNGEGTKNETDDGKKAMAAISFHPSAAWTIELYGDADQRPGQTDRETLQGFFGYKVDRGRFGVQYARQTRETSATTELELDVASIYGAIKAGEKTTILGRVDRNFDPIPDGDKIEYISFDKTAKATFALLGVDFALGKKVNLIPNVEAVFYDAVGGAADPDSDLIARVTLFAQF